MELLAPREGRCSVVEDGYEGQELLGMNVRHDEVHGVFRMEERSEEVRGDRLEEMPMDGDLQVVLAVEEDIAEGLLSLKGLESRRELVQMLGPVDSHRRNTFRRVHCQGNGWNG